MNYLTTQRVVEIAKDAVTCIVFAALMALTVFQYQTVQLLEKIIESDQTQEEIDNYVPEFDPCGLHAVDCAEAAVIEVDPSAEALAEYLRSKGGDELAEYATDIIELDRWQDAVAIAWQETQFCTTGVGASQNNCGGIKSWKTERVFKHYENVYDSVWDIAYLLNKPKFVDRTLAEMNGTYCVDMSTETGECPNWTETVTHIKSEVAVATTVQ